MIEQNYETLIIVLTDPLNRGFPDINAPNIRTVKYHSNRTRNMTILASLGFCFLAVRQFYPLFKASLALVSRAIRKLIAREQASPGGVSKQQPEVLFVVTELLHVATMLAICESCLKNGMTPYVATEDRSLLPSLQSHHIAYSHRASSFSVIPHIGKVISLVYNLRRHVNSFYRPRDNTDEFSPECLCRKTLLHNLPLLCVEAVYNITVIERMINLTSPDIICVMPDMYFLQQIAVVLAKRHGIPTLTCSAAWDFDHPRPLLRRFHVDKIATMGEKVKYAYINSGIEPDRVVIAGVAHFDRMFNRDKDAQALSDNGIDPNKKMIMYATQPSPTNIIEETLFGVINAILKMDGVQLVIKVHPREQIEIYQAISEKFHDSRLHVVKAIDLYAVISNCLLFITQFSTTALEAMMLINRSLQLIYPVSRLPFPMQKKALLSGFTNTKI